MGDAPAMPTRGWIAHGDGYKGRFLGVFGTQIRLPKVLKVFLGPNSSRRGSRFTMNSFKPAVLLSVALATAVEAACALKPTSQTTGQTTTTASAVSTSTPTQSNVDWFRTSPNAYAGRLSI